MVLSLAIGDECKTSMAQAQPAVQLAITTNETAWGETVGACVGLAYISDPAGASVTREYALSGAYEVNIGGTVVPATVSLKPLYDPEGTKTKR